MLNLPGYVLWLFLLVYLTRGQILDNANLTITRSQVDEITRASSISSIQSNEEEKENKTKSGSHNVEQNIPNIKEVNSLINKTAAAKPRTFMNRTEEFNRPEVSAVRNPRRRITNRTSTATNATEIPMLSPERRNSYLSIAERRKYYNRTRTQTKKPDANHAEPEHQETTTKPTTPTTETVQVNEIHVIKKPITKDFRVVTSEKNQTNNQRSFVSTPTNDTYGKPQSTRQSVIQSQYQFGQKLNLRKSARTQEQLDERLKRKKEKNKTEPMENSTNKLTKNYPTQSTKLVRIDKNLWPTTMIPKSTADDHNSLTQSNGNETVLEKLVNGIPVNNTDKIAPPSGFDQQQIPSLQSDTRHPLPLNTFNETETNDSRTETDQSDQSPNNTTDAAQSNATKHVTTHHTVIPLMNTTTARTIVTNVPKLNFTGKRNGKFSNPGLRKNQTILKSNLKNSTVGVYQTTPSVRVIPKEAAEPQTRVALAEADKKAEDKMISSSPPTMVESWSSTEDYPLTIELNENNKRVLSEMFQTSETPEVRASSKAEMTTSRRQASEMTQKTTAAMENIGTEAVLPPTTTPEVELTSDDSQITPPDNHLEDDYKAQGSRYSTKFYIPPNVNGSQVIRVVDEGEDEDYDVQSNPVGAAVYVLAIFGLVPLLLAFVFGTKFVMQRRKRQYECESDAKSELSTNETQIRKKKGSSALKKSPSNVTTTTLVTATRLPRVQHWENCDKQGNRNWEFPRSRLKLKTILGQGNFGQVWKAEAEDMAGHEGMPCLVAVKTVKEGATEKERAEFLKELEIMQQIGSHPNIVTLLGCCTDQEPYYLIMEYVKYGKLLTYLREHRVNENYYNFSKDSGALTSRDLTVFAYCVARGMEYLVSRGIIHRDLAARNVLVDHNKLCKIADFGMSRSVRDFENGQVYEERQHKGALPIRWMAPESLVYSVFTYKSDVWSFGIVMWEIVTLGSTPYPNMGAREVMRKVRDGYRLERPSHCKPEFYRLISHCWAHDPNKRPDFSELRHELGNLLDNPAKDGSYVDLDRFAIDNNFHVSSKTSDVKLLERSEFKTLQKFGQWDREDWAEDPKRSRTKRGKNNGKGTVTLTGQGSFTVNSRILEKEFNLI